MKLPFSFSLKFAFRLLLPGFLVGLGVAPLLQYALAQLRVTLSTEVAFFLACVVLGWLFVILDMQIYMLFEGRRYWPGIVRNGFLKLERRRLQRLKRAIESEGNDRLKYLEASVDIRRFPMDATEEYAARFPTRLGNLLAAFEEYPERTYGMDAIFYWPRVWLSLDENQRQELDNQQALADSAVYASVALYVDAVLCLGYAFPLSEIHGLATRLPGADTLLAASGFCALAGYLLYSGSLHAQAAIGELFKGVFDQFRSKIDVTEVLNEVSRIAPDAVPPEASSREKYRIAWRYLHNYRIKVDGETKRPCEFNKAPPTS